LQFTILKEIEFQEVMRRFEEEYAYAGGTRNWTANVLNLTDNLCKMWGLVRVRADQLGDVLLPWHRSKDDGGYDVVPRVGMLLSEVGPELDHRIRSNAPVFMNRIIELSDKPLGHIFLSQIIPSSEPSYAQVVPRSGHVVCLDGLHRLIALQRSGLPSYEVELVLALA
jgi:hypothetical protein